MNRKSPILAVSALCAALLVAAGIALAGQQNKPDRMGQSTAGPDLSQRTVGTSSSLNVTKHSLAPDVAARAHQALQPAWHSFTLSHRLYDAGDLAGAERAAQQTIVLQAGYGGLYVEESHRLIGQIRMKQGRNAEALKYFGAVWQPRKSTGLDLDVALCFARLGNFAAAKSFYSDRMITRYTPVQAEELPGTATLRALEASIQLARGLQEFLNIEQREQALQDLLSASKLAPQNGLINFYIGRTLEYLGRGYDGEPYFQLAAKYGMGETAAHARQNALDYAHRPAH